MGVVSLPGGAWVGYLRSIALEPGRMLATVTLLPGHGDHDGEGRHNGAAEARPLRSIRYDPANDVLELGVGGHADGPALRYFISAPRQIEVEESPEATGIVIQDATGGRTAIALRAVEGTAPGVARAAPLSRP
jgi:hypothetical protein